jgi:hypothetical protein
MGCNWIAGRMMEANAPEDVDAWLAGRELPSKIAEQKNRIDILLSAGGEMR